MEHMFQWNYRNHCILRVLAPKCIGRNILAVLMLFALLVADVSAGNNSESVMAESSSTQEIGGWSVETSLTFPMVRIYMLKFSYRHSDRAELGFGPAFQNWKNTDESFIGQANAYTLVLSYRYYFWKNFNAEIEFWPAGTNLNLLWMAKLIRDPSCGSNIRLGTNGIFPGGFTSTSNPE